MRIEMQDIVKNYGAVTVVDHVNLTIEDGEFFTLLGPSGCGKTTLLRMIAGFHDPNHGDICFDGKSILSLPAHKRDTGMVFQNYALFPHLTIFENIAYGLRARKVPQKEVEQRVGDVLDVVQLNDLAQRFPRQLSGGQQQRVALARALVIRPHVLLMDEPLSNLDAKLRVSMREEIRRIQKELNITTIYVTHDQEEAMAVSDRIAILHGGCLQQIDCPRGIYFAPQNRFVAQFMGSCNFFEGVCQSYNEEGPDQNTDQGLCTVLCDGKLFSFMTPAKHVGEEILFMLRPDWIRANASQDEANTFEGLVTDVSFLGTLTVYYVEALGRTLRVDVPARNGTSFAHKGDTISLSFASNAPVVVKP